MSDYQKGWYDAFDIISDYVEKEICLVTGSMIRRMKYEDWRVKTDLKSSEQTEGQGKEKIKE